MYQKATESKICLFVFFFFLFLFLVVSEKSAAPAPGLFKQFVAGGVGGASLVLVGQPLDTIKVRLQTMPTPKAGEAPLYKVSRISLCHPDLT
jgi:hypothetical protein